MGVLVEREGLRGEEEWLGLGLSSQMSIYQREMSLCLQLEQVYPIFSKWKCGFINLFDNQFKMYSGKKHVDRKIDVKQTLKFLGLVASNLYLAHQISHPDKKLIVKQIPLHTDSPQAWMQQEAILKKVCAGSIYYLKPESYDFRDASVYICVPVQHLSLQSLLWIHRKENLSVGREFVRQFTVRMFEGLARLKPTEIPPQNLKPSNLFMEERKGQDRNFLWGQVGLPSDHYNQNYIKVALQANKSVKLQPLEMQFYSLGVMLLQLITLQPVQDIDQVLRKKGHWDNIKNFKEAEDYYGSSLIAIIRYFIDPPKDPSLNRAIQDFKQLVEEEEQGPDYSLYHNPPQRLQKFLKEDLLGSFERRAREYIAGKNVSVGEVFDTLARLDPTFSFGVMGMTELSELLLVVGLKLQADQLLFVSTFYCSNSLIRYFKFLQRVFPPRELIENIIVKAVENYDNFRDFFEAQTNSRDFWKAQQIRQFLQVMDVSFEEKEILLTLKEWLHADKLPHSIKYDELYKAFKPILGMTMSMSHLGKTKTDPSLDSQSPLRGLMEQLMKKEPDLVEFFRKHDLKGNWIVDQKIQKTLRSYLKADEDTLRRGLADLWEKGNIPGDMSKQINYIYLLRNLQIYDSVDLLRKIIAQKVNEQGRDSFYKQYLKEEAGWNFYSLVDFNAQQNLEFQDRELKALFRELDVDNSGILEQKELYYRLTGLKEFDYEGIIETINHSIGRQGIFLFQEFRELDPKARLMLGHPSQLATILSSVGLELTEDHLGQLYSKFSLSGKFQYISFLLEFHQADRLFKSATKHVISAYYKNDFQKLFQIGLKDGKKKWHQQSLALVSQQLGLGFRQSTLQAIWAAFDPNGDQSLTKQEVASIFSFHLEQAEELQPRTVQSIHDRHKVRASQGEPVQGRAGSIDRLNKPTSGKDRGILDEFGRLGDRKLQELVCEMLRVSEGGKGKVDQDQCLRLLREAGLSFSKSEAVELLSRFRVQGQRRPTINFVGFYFFLLDSLYQQQHPKELARHKASLCILVIKEIKKRQGLSNADLFNHCRPKDRMRASQFQTAFKQLIEVDIYGNDLDQAWSFWGEQYLTPQDFDRILSTSEHKHTSNQSPSRDKQGLPHTEGRREPKFDRHQEQIPIPTLNNAISFGDRGTDRERTSTRIDNNEPRSIRSSFGGSKDQKEYRHRGQLSQQARERDREREPTGRFGKIDQRDREREPVSRFKGINQKDRQKDPSFRFGGRDQRDVQRKGGRFEGSDQKGRLGRFDQRDRGNHPLQEKMQLREVNEKSRVRMNEEKGVRSGKNIGQLLSLCRKQMGQHGQEYINELFSKSNSVDAKRMISCLSIHYSFSQQDAAALADHFATSGKIKLANLTSKLAQKENSNLSREGNSQQKSKRTPSKGERGLIPLESKLSAGKEGERGKLIDPRRQRVSAPIVQEHIRMLISVFSKKFQPSELESYFFADQELLSRTEFTAKCESVSNNFAGNIGEWMFDYLHPDSQDRVAILSFKLAMDTGRDDQAGQEEDYLPEEIQNQLRLVFEKADKDHSGFIQPNEIQLLLATLGFNESLKDLEAYFARIDQNFDNRISYPEFRRFIEDQILPQINSFDDDQEQLQELLRNNDIFRHGSISAPTLQALLEKYGVKLTMHQTFALVRGLVLEGTQINIAVFLEAVRNPALYSGKLKASLYKIRLRKKVQLRELQKVFENISTCFVLAYTSTKVENGYISYSSPYRPVLHDSALFYHDLPMKDLNRGGQAGESALAGEVGPGDVLVEVLLKEITGVPIPQRTQIKANIARRYMNISVFDLSKEELRFTLWQVQAEWDPDLEDVWRFGNDLRSLIVKIGNYQARKFQKYVLLFELVIGVNEGGRTLEINCGCTNLPLRELLVPEGRITKKLKLIAGLPNRSKTIDESAVSKRTGWKAFFGGEVTSELELQVVHRDKFEDLHRMIAALPAQVIFNRKAIHYLWVSREYLAQLASTSGILNRGVGQDERIRTFLLTLDVPQLMGKVWMWWKQKAEPRAKDLKTAKHIFRIFMQELYLVVHSRQFQLLKRHPCKQNLHQRSLLATRAKLIDEVFKNMEQWLYGRDSQGTYRRTKNYALTYQPLRVQELTVPKQQVAFMENLVRLAGK